VTTGKLTAVYRSDVTWPCVTRSETLWDCDVPIYKFRVYEKGGAIFYNLPMVNGDIKFAVCLSICSGRIYSETAERIWLKFCTGEEICLGHCVSHFMVIDRPSGPARRAENVVFLGRH